MSVYSLGYFSFSNFFYENINIPKRQFEGINFCLVVLHECIFSGILLCTHLFLVFLASVVHYIVKYFRRILLWTSLGLTFTLKCIALPANLILETTVLSILRQMISRRISYL
ncbi:hypothetical protein L1049_001729 [Liquidambar formosana]|uniref:Uncharacterized protein n=1 Tax=Liquidambar formosana TaxID=63359 RepID=A0AAP0N500_LIQFO